MWMVKATLLTCIRNNNWQIDDDFDKTEAVLLSAKLTRASTMPSIVSDLQSQLYEGEKVLKTLPQDVSTVRLDAELRRCVRANKETLFAKAKLDGWVAYFSVAWQHELMFEKIQQNRLYKVALGPRALGMLRRPEHNGGWFYLPLIPHKPLSRSDQIGPWGDLDTARKAVTDIVTVQQERH